MYSLMVLVMINLQSGVSIGSFGGSRGESIVHLCPTVRWLPARLGIAQV